MVSSSSHGDVRAGFPATASSIEGGRVNGGVMVPAASSVITGVILSMMEIVSCLLENCGGCR